MLVDLEIIGIRQFVSGGLADFELPMTDAVGSTHFDAGTTLPDGTIVYNYQNLWLCFDVKVPRRLRSIEFEATYMQAMNGPEFVYGQRFGWSIGTENAPGEESPFYWNVDTKSSGLLQKELKIPSGVAHLWLTYDYVGQNNCFVAVVRLPIIRGDAVGPGRIVVDGALKVGTPHIVIDGSLKEVSAYTYENGVWQPTS